MAPPSRRVQELVLLGTALFAVVWAIVRASLQSITMDEAFTYLYFVARPIGAVWTPSSNNHVLNSLLMWIAIHAFGTSNITVRAPALLGAVLYILTCKFLCQSVTERFSLQLPLFGCLIFNPFIFDFMVAARGYSLANAFLLVAIAVPPCQHRRAPPPPAECVLRAGVVGVGAFVRGEFFICVYRYGGASRHLDMGDTAARRRICSARNRVLHFPGTFDCAPGLRLSACPLADKRALVRSPLA